MAEYISKQDAVEALAKTMPTPATPDGAGEFDHEIHIADEAFADAIRIIKSLEPADVAPVVRCKDCKHVYCRIYHGWQEPIYTCTHLRSRWNTDNDLKVNLDDFCSYGERREE